MAIRLIVPIPVPEFVLATKDVVSSRLYIDRLKALDKDLEIGEPLSQVKACLGIVELAFSVGVPLDELPEMIVHLLQLLEHKLVLARSAAWALYSLHGGNGTGQQSTQLAWQPSNDEIESMRTVLMYDELDPTVAVFLLAIIHKGYKKRLLLIDAEQKKVALQLACQLISSDYVAISNIRRALRMVDPQWAVEALVEQLKLTDINLGTASLSILKELNLSEIARLQFSTVLAEFDQKYTNSGLLAIQQ